MELPCHILHNRFTWSLPLLILTSKTNLLWLLLMLIQSSWGYRSYKRPNLISIGFSRQWTSSRITPNDRITLFQGPRKLLLGYLWLRPLNQRISFITFFFKCLCLFYNSSPSRVNCMQNTITLLTLFFPNLLSIWYLYTDPALTTKSTWQMRPS